MEELSNAFAPNTTSACLLGEKLEAVLKKINESDLIKGTVSEGASEPVSLNTELNKIEAYLNELKEVTNSDPGLGTY